MNVARMNLVLDIVAREGQAPEGELRKVFGPEGGRIGRASDCDWVLPSPYISRYHATICWIDGAFCIVSTGENGVALNDAQAGLPQLEHRALKDGDRIFIDEYEIAVAIPVVEEGGAGAADACRRGRCGCVGARQHVSAAWMLCPCRSPSRLSRMAWGHFAATTPSLRTAFGLDPLRKSTPDMLAGERSTPLPDAAWNHSSGLADHFAPPRVNPRRRCRRIGIGRICRSRRRWRRSLRLFRACCTSGGSRPCRRCDATSKPPRRVRSDSLLARCRD